MTVFTRGDELVVEPLAERHLAALDVLFEAVGSSCFCRYWHFEGTKNEWLDRCAFRPEENREELAAAVRARHPSGAGLVALGASQQALGWMKLTARSAVPKLRRLPVYRSLDLGPEDQVAAVGCFVVHPSARRAGVAQHLLRGGVAWARAEGFRVIEGYPRRSAEPLHDEEVWQGPEAMFVSEGFSPFHDVAPYPVYRRVL